MNWKALNRLKVVAIVLTMVFFTPTVVQFSHSLDSEHSKVCTVLKTHLHEKKEDCSFCDFQISNFLFDFPLSLEVVTVQISRGVALASDGLIDNPPILSYLVRGPPHFS